jgi:hypothetical protein
MNDKRSIGLAALIGTLFLALVGSIFTLGVEEVKARKPIRVVEQPIPRPDGGGFDVGYNNPSATTYRCQWAWFTVDPTAKVLCGAIPAETIVFDGTSPRIDSRGRHYFTANIGDKELLAGEPGTFHVVVADRRYAGQTVTGYLTVQYDRNGTTDLIRFPAMQAEIQAGR